MTKIENKSVHLRDPNQLGNHFVILQCRHCENIFAERWGFYTVTGCPLCGEAVHVLENEFRSYMLSQETKEQLKFWAAFREFKRHLEAHHERTDTYHKEALEIELEHDLLMNGEIP